MFNNVTLIGYLGSDAESRTTRTRRWRSFRSRQSGPGTTARRESASRRPLGIAAWCLAGRPNTRLRSQRAPTSKSSARSRRAASSAETARRSPSPRSECTQLPVLIECRKPNRRRGRRVGGLPRAFARRPIIFSTSERLCRIVAGDRSSDDPTAAMGRARMALVRPLLRD